jgi:predicted RNA binding protein YcfA (HicA-like mRNA interferase family)
MQEVETLLLRFGFKLARVSGSHPDANRVQTLPGDECHHQQVIFALIWFLLAQLGRC